MAGQGVFIQRLIVDEDLWKETDAQSMYREKLITRKPRRIFFQHCFTSHVVTNFTFYFSAKITVELQNNL